MQLRFLYHLTYAQKPIHWRVDYIHKGARVMGNKCLAFDDVVNKRKCVICHAPLSRYNKTDTCFHHPEVKPTRKKVDPDPPATKDQGVEKLSNENLLSAVCGVCDISPDEIFSTSRKAPIALARQILMYLLHIDKKVSLPKIGTFLLRDHTTVLHGVQKISTSIEKDPVIKNLIEKIRTCY